RPSKSAFQLARGLGVRKIKNTNSRYRPRTGDTIINWGSNRNPFGTRPRWINEPPLRSINKLTCFNILKEHNVSIPTYTTDSRSVRNDGDSVWLARHTLTG